MEADTVYRGDVNAAADYFLHLQQFTAQPFVAMKNLFPAFVKLGSFPRQSKLLLTAINDQHIKVFFHCTQLLADRGLGHSIQLRRARETLVLNQVGKYLEILNMHCCRSINLSNSNARSTIIASYSRIYNSV